MNLNGRKVIVKDGNVDKALRKLKKKVSESGLLQDLQDRQKIEGLNKNTGVHPSGISISYYNNEDIMPLQKTGDGEIVSAYDMNNVSEITVKFDILGLRTLTVVYDTCQRLGLDFKNLDFDNSSTYKFLQDLSNPKGLFQIEANTNFHVCKKVKPRNMLELACVLSLARPGALDFLDQYARYVATGQFQSVHPFFDDILGIVTGKQIGRAHV